MNFRYVKDSLTGNPIISNEILNLLKEENDFDLKRLE
jgi:hypothetical protein